MAQAHGGDVVDRALGIVEYLVGHGKDPVRDGMEPRDGLLEVILRARGRREEGAVHPHAELVFGVLVEGVIELGHCLLEKRRLAHAGLE
eukprot:CAMPEP_0175586456 /NCGR_PEP_ID=MMETSP0096-20121207/50247_1 /TAXON_ID=311494 /ORGANISM="Alexandrium monilatum, Strain CCMP3105" /LENGTH=88 /DNA_ID=CAMNT_0016890331 /DNA_START=16 /DNA_END=279 /DNA_ORIENTATION=-